MRFGRPSLQAVLGLTAVLCGLLAALGTTGYIDQQVSLEREKMRPQQTTVAIVVAQRDLGRGDTVGPETMAVRQVPADLVPSSAIFPDRFDSFVGLRLTIPMRAGEPLLPVAIAGADAASFSGRLRAGTRAMTIPVDEANALSGMLQPGDRIDLLLTARSPEGGSNAAEQTMPLMQDVLILATGRQVRPDGHSDPEMERTSERQFGAITIEINADEAQKLIVAQRSGRITAILRNPEDRGEISRRAIDLSKLLGVPKRSSGFGPVGPEVIVGGQGVLSASFGQRIDPQPPGGMTLSLPDDSIKPPRGQSAPATPVSPAPTDPSLASSVISASSSVSGERR
jgi:pilus assembly protein CpaB